jgi:RNA polymerase sigma-70 factor (ECF subfamily)
VHDDDDPRLLRLLRTGDTSAFARLYERYRGLLYAYCVRILIDPSLAEDAVQETFLKLRSHAGGITDPGVLRSWLYRVARNEALGMVRQRRNGRTVDPESAWDNETPESALDRKDAAGMVQSVLSALKEEYRDVIVLREFEGLTYAEIAAVTGDSESSVKSRLFKARKALAKKLAPWWKERDRQ